MILWEQNKRHKLIEYGIGSGRPRGSRSQIKRIKKIKRLSNDLGKSNSSTSPKKSGPSNVFRTGHLLEVDMNPENHQLTICNQVEDENSSISDNSLFTILYSVVNGLCGQFISIHRIENLFSQFHLYYLARGRRTSLTVSYDCNTWLTYRTSSPLFHKLIHHLSRSNSPLVGLKNLGKLLQPNYLSLISPLEVV